MREIRLSGSEGGGAKPIVSPYPYQFEFSYSLGTNLCTRVNGECGLLAQVGHWKTRAFTVPEPCPHLTRSLPLPGSDVEWLSSICDATKVSANQRTRHIRDDSTSEPRSGSDRVVDYAI